MPLRQDRVVEILLRRPRHADPLHHGPRTGVVGHREGYDFLEPELLEAVANRGAGRLAGVALPPMLSGEAPADLDAGRERRREVDVGQPDEADEWGDSGDLDRPAAVPPRLEMAPETGRQLVALLAVE